MTTGPNNPGPNLGAVDVTGPAAPPQVTLGLIGVGAWGKNYITTCREMNIRLLTSSRVTPVWAPFAGTSWSKFPSTAKLREAFFEDWKKQGVQGVVVATPPPSNVGIALEAQWCGLPTLVEKPIGLSLKQATALRAAASRPTMVNHIHLYTQAYQVLRQRIGMSPIQRIDIAGHDTTSRHPYSGLYDYGCHWVALSLDLMSRAPPPEVRCGREGQDLYYVTLDWPEHEAAAHLLVGTGAAQKAAGMIVKLRDGRELRYFGLENKVTNEHGVQVYFSESPLQCAVARFVEYVNGSPGWQTHLELAFDVMRVLDLAAGQVKSTRAASR